MTAQNPALLSAASLNIEFKKRSNLFPWRGQFSPQLIDAFLSSYAKNGDHVLDPFAGSGTVMYECGRRQLRCTGTELNPAAVCLSQTYEFINMSTSAREEIVRTIDTTVSDILNAELELFAQDSNRLQDRLTNRIITAYQDEKVCMARRLWESLIVLLDSFPAEMSVRHLSSTWKRLRSTVLGLPFSQEEIRVYVSDARRSPLENESVDLVITSPPYINVFNYHQQSRKSVESLGWKPLVIATSEIGANRKFRGNRFLTVVQYCLDISDVLKELHRICKRDSHLIFVLGRESNVRKTPFRNGDMFREIATSCCGYENTLNQERVFTNKFGQRIYEDIIHLRPTMLPNSPTDPRAVALNALSGARADAPSDSLGDLTEAIRMVTTIERSPVFQPRDAIHREEADRQ